MQALIYDLMAPKGVTWPSFENPSINKLRFFFKSLCYTLLRKNVVKQLNNLLSLILIKVVGKIQLLLVTYLLTNKIYKN